MTKVPIEKPTGTHSERQRALRAALDDATRRRDQASMRLLRLWLDEEYVSRAHLRARDSEIVRLRRWLRETAA